jgi:hypothetical protein
MPTIARLCLAFGLVAIVAACAPKVEEVEVVEVPVTTEPTYTGPYK